MKDYGSSERQLLQEDLKSIDWLYGPWDSIEEFENKINELGITQNNIPNGTKIRVISDNSFKEFYRLNNLWKELIPNASNTQDGIISSADYKKLQDVISSTFTYRGIIDSNKANLLTDADSIGVYYLYDAHYGMRGLLSVQTDFYNIVSQILLSSVTPVYNGETMSTTDNPSIIIRKYINRSWSKWSKVDGDSTFSGRSLGDSGYELTVNGHKVVIPTASDNSAGVIGPEFISAFDGMSNTVQEHKEKLNDLKQTVDELELTDEKIREAKDAAISSMRSSVDAEQYANKAAVYAGNIDEALQEIIEAGDIPEATIAQVTKNTADIKNLNFDVYGTVKTGFSLFSTAGSQTLVEGLNINSGTEFNVTITSGTVKDIQCYLTDQSNNPITDENETLSLGIPVSIVANTKITSVKLCVISATSYGRINGYVVVSDTGLKTRIKNTENSINALGLNVDKMQNNPEESLNRDASDCDKWTDNNGYIVCRIGEFDGKKGLQVMALYDNDGNEFFSLAKNKQDKLIFDAEPSDDSTNPIQSRGVFKAIKNILEKCLVKDSSVTEIYDDSAYDVWADKKGNVIFRISVFGAEHNIEMSQQDYEAIVDKKGYIGLMFRNGTLSVNNLVVNKINGKDVDSVDDFDISYHEPIVLCQNKTGNIYVSDLIYAKESFKKDNDISIVGNDMHTLDGIAYIKPVSIGEKSHTLHMNDGFKDKTSVIKTITTSVPNKTNLNILDIGSSFFDVATFTKTVGEIIEGDGISVNHIGHMNDADARNVHLAGGTWNFIYTNAGRAVIVDVQNLAVLPTTHYPGTAYVDANGVKWCVRGWKLDANGNGKLYLGGWKVDPNYTPGDGGGDDYETYANNLPQSGTLVKTSNPINNSTSVGQDNIVYTSKEIVYYNPFWNPATNKLDFRYYINKWGFSAPDVINLYFGGNDMSNAYRSDDYIADIVDKAKYVIDQIHSDYPNCKITLPSGGLQNDKTAIDSYTRPFRQANTRKYYELLVNQFGMNSNYADYVAIPPTLFMIDRVRGAHESNQWSNRKNVSDISPRYDGYIDYDSDVAHLNTKGFQQLADVVVPYIYYMLNK